MDEAGWPTPRERVLRSFRERFGAQAAWLVRSPGRVNLLGEHTDYNQGFVLPMAIEQAVWIALRPRLDRQVRLLSLDLNEERGFDLDALHLERGWCEYAKGVARVLMDAGLPLAGIDAVLAGDIPMGAGLSSSAALSVGMARALAAACGADWQPLQAAQWAQAAENEWVGVRCGIMDPLIVAAAREGHALLVDCRDLALTAVPLPQGTAVAVLDTGTRRGLVSSGYNDLRRRCENAARLLGVSSLRDASRAELEQRWEGLPEGVREAARHVLNENERTQEAAAALQRGDAARFGQLMRAGHASLRDDLGVSSEALDAIVEAALEAPGCHGARMTGAGFAGCAVALIDGAQVDAFSVALERGYRRRVGQAAAVHPCRPAASAGAERLA